MSTAEALAPFLAGPASAVFVMLILLLGLWKLTTEKLIPLLSAALNRHLDSLDELVSGNREDHRVMVECLQRIEVKIDSDKESKLKAVH
tara:strand:- start:19641 stop:19907 length:267 start_codon:yes stop_codon:yes gene_type:complete